MGINLQILLFLGIIVLQIALITVTAKGLKALQRTMSISEQKTFMRKTRSCEEYGAENKKEEEKHTEKKEIKDLRQTSGEEELLFIKQVELNKTDPIMEINIVADRKEK